MRPASSAGRCVALGLIAAVWAGWVVVGQDKRRDDYRIGVQVRMVTLDVTVLDGAGQRVDALTADDFRVFDEGDAQELALFHPADLPISLGLVIDTSGSMRERLNLVNEAVLAFLKYSNPDNQVFVVDFAHDQAELLLDFTQDRDDVKDAILERMLAGGGTPLWDALYLGMEHIARGKFERKALVVISDGEDKDSRYGFPEVLARVKNSDVQIYFIALQKRRADTLFDLDDMSRDAAGREMSILGDLSGGRLFVPEDLQALDRVTADLATELRHQYRIGFHPTASPAQAAFRRLEVKLSRPGTFKIYTRRGYFHPGR